MGKWAKALFGREKFGSVGIVLAGTIRHDFEKKVLRMFDKVLSSKDSVYHGHLVIKNGIAHPLVTNVYGAPAMVDVLTEMHDGGCRTIIFIGLAYGGFRNLDVGAVVIPEKSYHFDGLYHTITPDRRVARADKTLREKLEEIFTKNNMPYVRGINISVPAVTLQPSHANEHYRKIKPLTVEMELAACYTRSKEIGIRAAGALIISDNREVSIGDEIKKERRVAAKMKVIATVVENLRKLTLPPLSTKKKFTIDEHLASIIESPEDARNVYKTST